MKYRKKFTPEAFRLIQTSDYQPGTRPPQWLLDAVEKGTVTPMTGGGLLIETLEGTMTAQVGDWIMQGESGELYPCKPDIFARTYEEV